MLWLLITYMASATPAPEWSDVAWLPLEHAEASVRLHQGRSPAEPDLAPLLVGGRRVGAESLDWITSVLTEHPDLGDPSEIWRVPADRLPALRATGAVAEAWGHPPPAPPPSTTPDFDPLQQVLLAPPAGIGVSALRAWPGSTGLGIMVSNIEYDFDPAHEAFGSNPPSIGPGRRAGEYEYHGNAVFALVGSGDDGFGVTGIAPLSDMRIVYPLTPAYDIAEAVLRASSELEPGDVLLIEQQLVTPRGFAPVSADSSTFQAIALATAAGITVVEPTGNGGLDLDSPYFEGWFDPVNDHGGILVGAAEPDTGRPAEYSGHGDRVDLHVRVGNLHTATTEDFSPDLYFPDRDRTRAYTTRFSGTSGASAIVAGACASLQGIALDLRGAPLPPSTLRDGLKLGGRPLSEPPGSRHRVGVPLDMRRTAQIWLSP